ncbi:hypothetical protein [Clostridioides sp. ES-S-0054-01]|uniref:hypothetical protein n=1 Tax=unclassified Clostridioides TaxID=2635829 RepID=UPI001D657639|nr:hypothetical protein [Clostridioides sp. ES-S-0171-01]MCC0687724.1 hypothetical protein [Clostridioides sp. ES-S-0056-01]MCC0716084.1 hypothetical protein [Clostridioides sp. ES-S-0077-01]UDN53541.1 hypothetical protein JJC02_11570 [Clostridioides sp. ES-S-0054-01]
MGKFILGITIIKGYNDDEDSIDKIKSIVYKLSQDKIIVERINDGKFKKKLGSFEEISKELCNIKNI